VANYHKFYESDDARWKRAIALLEPYPAPVIADADLRVLARRAAGVRLEHAVSSYASKHVGEDQAETARWLLTHLPDALLQVATKPHLPGSQRLLHVMAELHDAPAAGGPGIEWWVDVAVGRAAVRDVAARIDQLAAADAARELKAAAAHADGADDLVARAALRLLKRVPPADVAALLPASRALLRDALPRIPIALYTDDVLRARHLTQAVLAAAAAGGAPINPQLAAVDRAIDDTGLRAIVRGVEPAVVRIGGATGVIVHPRGVVLTAAHVAEREGARYDVDLADGRRLPARCTVVDDKLDLAIVEIAGEVDLPFLSIAPAAPAAGAPIVVIGYPRGPMRLVTVIGAIRGFVGDPLGEQRLGHTKHDAPTSDGHSGSPVLDAHGQLVALHNSWDERTRMRHAVTWQAVTAFLRAAQARRKGAEIVPTEAR
jgi:S1-C subfamily serine protease